MTISKIEIESVEKIPLISGDVMDMVMSLATEIETLKRRVTELELKNVHTNQPRHPDTIGGGPVGPTLI